MVSASGRNRLHLAIPLLGEDWELGSKKARRAACVITVSTDRDLIADGAALQLRSVTGRCSPPLPVHVFDLNRD